LLLYDFGFSEGSCLIISVQFVNSSTFEGIILTLAIYVGVDLLQSADAHKDQTLFLSQIHQAALQRTMFPVGTMKKTVVKSIAAEAGLDSIVKKKEV